MLRPWRAHCSSVAALSLVSVLTRVPDKRPQPGSRTSQPCRGGHRRVGGEGRPGSPCQESLALPPASRQNTSPRPLRRLAPARIADHLRYTRWRGLIRSSSANAVRCPHVVAVAAKRWLRAPGAPQPPQSAPVRAAPAIPSPRPRGCRQKTGQHDAVGGVEIRATQGKPSDATARWSAPVHQP